MKIRFIWRAIFALIFIGLLVLGGVAIYQLGFNHGAMTNITLPEAGELPVVPYGYHSQGWHYGPRIGLLGLFPLLCFGGFFFLILTFGFGFISRRQAWRHYGPGWQAEHWKHYGPPWGRGHSPWSEEQPEAEAKASSKETESPEG